SLPIERGEYCDFIAVNYYTRSTVSGFGDGVREGAPKNDLGWEIYPEGIVRCTQKLYSLIKRPIYITENGTCDNTDVFRCRYIYEHLSVLCKSELPVERYYHWCFCDNFEWIEGESARFGLVHVDYETQKRTTKNAGDFYSEVIRAGGMTEEIYEKYVKNQEYHF
ncbi:MAG: family 1 glycosylhydrolase, partial [Oscillospiraceae bacterium]